MNVSDHIDKLKKKNHVIISTNVEKSDIIQHSFMIKTLSKLGTEENYFNLIESIHQKNKQKQTSYLMVKNDGFFLGSGTKQGFPLLSLLLNIVLKIPARTIRQEKEKDTQTGKKEIKRYYLQIYDCLCSRSQGIYKTTRTNK